MTLGKLRSVFGPVIPLLGADLTDIMIKGECLLYARPFSGHATWVNSLRPHNSKR